MRRTMASNDHHHPAVPRTPTDHILDFNENEIENIHDHDHDHEHEISAATASDNVHTSRAYPHHHTNLEAAPDSNANDPGASHPNISRVGPGHERGFVQPASYLRRRGLSHPMAPSQPERAVDAEEQMGLVSTTKAALK